MPTNKYAVIFACDHNYIWPALLAANGIVKHARNRNFDVRIFSCSHIPDGFIERCEEGVTAEILSMGDFSVKTDITARYSMATFARMFALEKTQHEYERVLYLDADISVRHGDVGVFWDVDFNGKPAAAVRDCLGWGEIRPTNLRYINSLGSTPESGGYFNGGVLLADCKAFRDQNIVSKARNFLEEKPELCKYHDESAFNAALAGNWSEISYLWNWQMRMLHHILLVETRDPHVVHFNARRKPWRDRDRLLGTEFKGPLMKLADDVGWDAFVDEYSHGQMRPRKERIRATQMRDLYDTLPRHLQWIKAYMNRTDFIDYPESFDDR